MVPGNRPVGTRILRRPKELEAIASPVRARLVQCLDLFGPSSVAALAAHAGRKPPSLYYHLKLLADAGLVVAAGTGPSTRRPSAVYALSARRFVAKKGRLSQSYQQAYGRAAGTFLRLAHRELIAGLGANAGGRARIRRYELWLSAGEQTRLKRLLAELDRFARSCAHSRRGTPTALTIVVSPVRRGVRT